MELKWLEDFLTLVDTRNFSRSAELRYTTQPAFSRRIKALEEWVGAPLFERSSHPIGLTDAGDQFRGIAEEVVRRLYQGREELRLATAGAAGTIKFAATHSLSLTFFPAWIGAIEDAGGVLNIRLDTGHAGACVQMLLKGRCHFMLSHTHPAVETGLDPRQFLSQGGRPGPSGAGDHPRRRRSARRRACRERPRDPAATPSPMQGGGRGRERRRSGRAVTHMLRRRDGEAHLDRQFVSQPRGGAQDHGGGRGAASPGCRRARWRATWPPATLVPRRRPRAGDLDVEKSACSAPPKTLSATAEAFLGRESKKNRPSTGLRPTARNTAIAVTA